MKNYYVNEGNKIGGQEAQPLGVEQARIKAKVDIEKGEPVEISSGWEVQPAIDQSVKFIGLALTSVKAGDTLTVETEGLMKVVAKGNIGAGAEVVCAGDKKVKASTGTGTIVGIALNDASDGEISYIKFR